MVAGLILIGICRGRMHYDNRVSHSRLAAVAPYSRALFTWPPR